MVIPRFLLKHWRHSLGPTLIFWLTVWVANLVGVLFTATMLNIADVFHSPVSTELRYIMDFKMRMYLEASSPGELALAWWRTLARY